MAIIKPPIALVPSLMSILEPGADIKVKHGVTGLLRHLAYHTPARAPLGEAGTIERLVASNIFKDTSDIADIVQLSAIGIVKNLCNGNGLSIDAPFSYTGRSPPRQQIIAFPSSSDRVVPASNPQE